MPISKELIESSIKLLKDEIRSHQRTSSWTKADIQIHPRTVAYESRSQNSCNEWMNFHRIKRQTSTFHFQADIPRQSESKEQAQHSENLANLAVYVWFIDTFLKLVCAREEHERCIAENHVPSTL